MKLITEEKKSGSLEARKPFQRLSSLEVWKSGWLTNGNRAHTPARHGELAVGTASVANQPIGQDLDRELSRKTRRFGFGKPDCHAPQSSASLAMTPAVKPVSYLGHWLTVLNIRRDFISTDFIKNLLPYGHIALWPQRLAFTMAEILISLTIIGIIAALTLPSLRDNINEKAWATQRKALYSRMSQALEMLPSLNGYGIVMNNDGTVNETETASKAAQAFITDGLSKVLKINNICDGATVANLEKCGFPKKFTKMGTNSKLDTPTKLTDLNGYFNSSTPYVNYSQIDTQTAAFETANGESVLTFYNPNCSYTYGLNKKNNEQNLMQPTMCANFIYDLNGKKGPNKVGKDIGFMTAFYPTDGQIVAPYPAAGHLVVEKSKYSTFSIGTGNLACRDKYGNDAKMANIEELKSIFVNNNMGYINSTVPAFLGFDRYISSSITISQLAYAIEGYMGKVVTSSTNYSGNINSIKIFCVKNN